jgi:hypothetical protein
MVVFGLVFWVICIYTSILKRDKVNKEAPIGTVYSTYSVYSAYSTYESLNEALRDAFR